MGASTPLQRVRRVSAVAAALAALTGCATGGSGGTTGGVGAGDTAAVTVAAVIKGLDNPFFRTMEEGIQAGARSTGVDTTVQAANSITDTTGQAAKLTALAGQDFDCYIVNPITGTNLVQGLATLAARGRTIVNIDSPVDADAARAAGATPTTYIGTDNMAAGELAGDQMRSLVGTGQVAVIGGPAGDVTSNSRIDGFVGAVKRELDVVASVPADWNRDRAAAAAADQLREHPALKGFYVANDDMAMGVVEAVAAAGRADEVAVIGTDGIEEALVSIERGDLTATVAQYPYTIGIMGIEACAAAAAGRELPSRVDAPVELVTAAVVDQALASSPGPFAGYEDPLAALP